MVTGLQISTVFWVCKIITFVCNNVTQNEIIPILDGFATEKLKHYESPSTDRIPPKLIRTEDNALRSEIHELINWWDSGRRPLLSEKHKMSTSILMSRLCPIFGYHQCWFEHTQSDSDNMFRICHTSENRCEDNGTTHQLFIDFEEIRDSLRREAFYKILIEFDAPVKLLRLLSVFKWKSWGKLKIYRTLRAC